MVLPTFQRANLRTFLSPQLKCFCVLKYVSAVLKRIPGLYFGILILLGFWGLDPQEILHFERLNMPFCVIFHLSFFDFTDIPFQSIKIRRFCHFAIRITDYGASCFLPLKLRRPPIFLRMVGNTGPAWPNYYPNNA